MAKVSMRFKFLLQLREVLFIARMYFAGYHGIRMTKVGMREVSIKETLMKSDLVIESAFSNTPKRAIPIYFWL